MSSEKLFLGTVQMGLPYGVNNRSGRVSYAESEKILMHAHSSGIRTLDSAEAYGDAHSVIGRFHKENPGMRFEVITKLAEAESPEQVRRKVQEFLKELHVDSLNALMFHSFKEYDGFKDCRSIIPELKEAGFIKRFGVSAYTNSEVESLISDPLVDLIQLPFNLLDNEHQRGSLLRKASDLGKEIHTRSAFLQGLFFMDSGSAHPAVRVLKESLDQIRQITKREKISLPALALGYCLSKPYIHRVLIGVDSIGQLEQNIRASNHKIKPELLEQIDTIFVKNAKYLNPTFWKIN